MSAVKRSNSSFTKATCAALIAASFAVGRTADADVVQSLERYCHSSWRQAGIPPADWEDCTQDTMLELLSRLPRQALPQAVQQASSTERRELMRSIWCVVQRWRRHVRRRPVSWEGCGDTAVPSCESFVEGLADAELRERGFARLSQTQRAVLELYGEGYSIADIAARLQLPAARVSDQKYKAIAALRKLLVMDTELA